MPETPNESKSITLNAELAKTAFDWVTRLIGLVGILVAAYVAQDKHTSSERIPLAVEDRISKLEQAREEMRRQILELYTNQSAQKQALEDAKDYRLTRSR